MPSESALATLLSELQPVLLGPSYVFCRVPVELERACLALKPLSTFREEEGLSVVIEQGVADRLGLAYDSVHRCITLGVHSSLEAVGLTAAVSTVLAEAGLSANVIAAYHHDHVFVPAGQEDLALAQLLSLGS